MTLHWRSAADRKLRKLLAAGSITPYNYAALSVLATYTDWKTGANAWPSARTVGRACRMDEKTVRDSFKLGVRYGVIQKTGSGGGSGPTARGNTYRFIAHLEGQPEEGSGQGPDPGAGRSPGDASGSAPEGASGTDGTQPFVPLRPDVDRSHHNDQTDQKKPMRRVRKKGSPGRESEVRAVPPVASVDDVREQIRLSRERRKGL